MSTKPKNKFIWYASSNFPTYKNYIEDILLILKDDNILIPPFDIFRAHDNKGYQALLRNKLSLPTLHEYYFGTLEELDSVISQIQYPIVLKGVKGSGSKNVTLVHNKHQLRQIVKKRSRNSSFLIDLSKRYLKRYVFTNKYTYDNSCESLYYENFILQEFIPDLYNDWKILIFFDKYYVLEREVRKKDFRASGSGKFLYREFNLDMLDFCKEIYDKLQTPWLSLDVCFDGNDYQLIEFQGVSFGLFTLMKAPYYFVQDSGNKWQKIHEKSDLSTEYAKSFIKHIEKKFS
jgi:glutathione synthase/RimK-type ligase-like ATP-grasp enzyme